MAVPSGPKYLDSSNRSAGFDVRPLGVIIHDTFGAFNGAVSWLRGAAGGSSNRSSSAHFVVARDGRVVQLVPLPGLWGPQDGRHKAWHIRSENAHYVGVEHESSDDAWTDVQLAASAELVRAVCDFYGVPLVGPPGGHNVRIGGFRGVGGHDNVVGNDHSDPGPNFPWERYMALVRGADGGFVVDAEAKQRFDDLKGAVSYVERSLEERTDALNGRVNQVDAEIASLRAVVDRIAAKVGA